MKKLIILVLSAASLLFQLGCTGHVSGTVGLDSSSLTPFEFSYPSATIDLNVNSSITPSMPATQSGVIYRMSPSDLAALPVGLSFNSSTGSIEGTPTTSLTPARSFRVYALAGGKTYEASLVLEVRDVALDFNYADSPKTVMVGNSLSWTPTLVASNSTAWTIQRRPGTSIEVSALGLTFNATTGLISGSVLCSATPGTYDYRVSATNSSSSDVFDIAIVVVPRTGMTLSYAGAPFTFTRGSTISSASPTYSGPAGITFSANPSLPAGLTLNSTTGVISGTPSAVSMPSGNFSIIASEGVCSNSALASVAIAVDEKPLTISLPVTTYSFVGSAAIAAFAPSVDSTGSSATSWTLTPVAPATGLLVNSGLSFSPTSGQISGTAGGSVVGTTYQYDIQAFNAHKASNVLRISITVTNPGDPLVFSFVGSPYTKTRGEPVSIAPTVTSGGATSWTVTPQAGTTLALTDLGLAFNTASGSVSGSVLCNAPLGTYSYTVQGSNSFTSSTATLSLVITDRPALSLNYAATLYSYTRSQAVPTILPDPIAVAGLSYAISPSLPSGLSFNTQTGEVSGVATLIPFAGNSFTVIATDSVCSRTSSDSFNLVESLDIQAAPTSLSGRVGSPMTSAPVVLSGVATSWTNLGGISGTTADLTTDLGLTLNTTTGAVSGTPSCSAALGTYNYRFRAQNSFTSATKDLQIVIQARQPISLSYAGSPFDLVRDTAMTASAPTVTGPSGLTYSVSPSLPAGLSLNSSTGVLSGTPTVVSTPTAVYTVTASEGICANSQTAAISLKVDEKPIAIALSPTSYSFTWGDPINAFGPTVVPGSSNASTWLITPVAPATGLAADTGLAFSVLGQISGTPSSTNVGSTFSYDIRAQNAAGMNSNTIRISITVGARPAPTFHYDLSSFSLQRGVTAMTASPIQDTGSAISTYAISPSLPSGLSLNTTTGVISGTPTAGTAVDTTGTTYTITATDGQGLTGTSTISIRILHKAPVSVSYTSTTIYQYYRSTGITPSTVVDDPASVTYSINPALPSEFTFDTTTGRVVVSQHLNSAFGGPYTVTATNSGGSVSTTLPITVKSAHERAVNHFVWTGATGEGKWTTAGNWQKLTGSAAYPNAATHMAFFDGTCSNCNVSIDASVVLQGVYIAPTYTGTITQGASSTISVGRPFGLTAPSCSSGGNLGRYGQDWGWVQNAGTFVGNTADITLTSLDLNGGSFTSTAGLLKMNLVAGSTSASDINYRPVRCRPDTSATSNETVGFKVATGANFYHNSGTVSVVASYNDDTTCNGSAFVFSAPAAGLNFNHLTLESYSPLTSYSGASTAAKCNTAASGATPATLPQYIEFLAPNLYRVSGDLNLKRGAFSSGGSTALNDLIQFSGSLTIECANAAAIAATSSGHPTNKDNCWQGGNVGLVASSTSDQTYSISPQSANTRLIVNKPVGTLLKPATGKESSNIRLFTLQIDSGTFKAPSATLALDVFSPRWSIMSTPLLIKSFNGTFDPSLGTVHVKTRSLYDPGTSVPAGGAYLKPTWTGSVGANVLTLNNLIVDLNHVNNKGTNYIDFGSIGSESDRISIAGDLTVLDGFLHNGDLDLHGNFVAGCASGSNCADDLAVRASLGSEDFCRSAISTGITFVGSSNQFVTQAAGAKLQLSQWSIAKPAPYSSKVLLGSNLTFSGRAGVSSGSRSEINVNAGLLDLNGYSITSNLTVPVTSCSDVGVTFTSYAPKLKLLNTPNAELLCDTSTSPDVDQVTTFTNGGVMFKTANPALCYEPEL